MKYCSATLSPSSETLGILRGGSSLYSELDGLRVSMKFGTVTTMGAWTCYTHPIVPSYMSTDKHARP